VCSFYKNFVETVVPVSSLEVAEMSKILENTFRLVNISVSNELLKYTDSLGISLWEVISASATKPFGFIPHYPGPGIGGHCIPVDPYYLLDDARRRGVNLNIIEAAGKVNDQQPKKIVEKTLDILEPYKENVADKRESPALKILELLKEENIEVSYHDPFVPELDDIASVDLSKENIEDKDIIIIATSHSNIDYDALVSMKKPILDTRNKLKDYSSSHIYRI
jgi:UDP-N-acetyl-D-glucosamine dehydrogenase